MGMLRVIEVAAAVGVLAVAGVESPHLYDKVFPPEVSEGERIVTALDGALADSVRARTALAAIVVEVNHCRKRPGVAASEVAVVTDDRQRGADGIAKVARPEGDSQAQELLDAFGHIMDTSQKADERYAAWLTSWDKQYMPIKKAGCHIPRSGATWSAFEAADDSAGDAKTAFLHLYEKPAKKYHLRLWTRKAI